VLELAHRILDVTGSASTIVYRDLPTDDPSRRRPDISLAASALDWAPTIDLADGLARTVEHFRTITS
jgi:UDP-glucuronate decarboxylase